MAGFCYNYYIMYPWPLQKIHISWLVAAWCLGVVVGVVSVMALPYGLFSGLAWLFLGLVLLIPLVKTQRRWMILLVLVSGALAGLWRGGSGQVGLGHYEQLFGQRVELSGQVSEDPDIDKRGQTVLRLSDIEVEGAELPGNVWVVTSKNDVIRRSDRVVVSGRFGEGFGSFVGSIYQAEIGEIERPVPGDVAVGVRDWFADRVRQHVPETEAALGLGYLLGLRRALPSGLVEALQIAGLTHVIVASGYNLTILVRLSRRLFVRVSKYLAMLSSVAMILSFIAVTGTSPSMSRAGLVAGLSLAAWYYGRTIHPLVLLLFAAAITLLISPQFGWNDLGWQLSFAAFAGVIIFAPLIQRYFFGKKEPGVLRQIVGETLSAQIFTLPLIVVAFGVVSNVALVANILILPFVPLAMLLVFLTGIFASVPLLGALLAAPTTWLLSYMVGVAEWLAGQPWAQMEVSMSWWMVVVAYGVLALVIWWMQRATGFRLRESSIVE